MDPIDRQPLPNQASSATVPSSSKSQLQVAAPSGSTPDQSPSASSNEHGVSTHSSNGSSSAVSNGPSTVPAPQAQSPPTSYTSGLLATVLSAASRTSDMLGISVPGQDQSPAGSDAASPSIGINVKGGEGVTIGNNSNSATASSGSNGGADASSGSIGRHGNPSIHAASAEQQQQQQQPQQRAGVGMASPAQHVLIASGHGTGPATALTADAPASLPSVGPVVPPRVSSFLTPVSSIFAATPTSTTAAPASSSSSSSSISPSTFASSTVLPANYANTNTNTSASTHPPQTLLHESVISPHSAVTTTATTTITATASPPTAALLSAAAIPSLATTATTAATTTGTLSRMEPVLDPHVMAMDAFQLHNGVTPFNNYNDQYDQSQEYDTNAQAGNINEANGHSYLTSAPGSYPSEPYGNRGYGPLDGDSASDLELMMTDDGGSGYAAPTSIGFVYANEKRFSDFHALFRSVPDEEKLIEDYGCALQKEILVQGRLYISENHVCFNANIFGWVTNLVIAFSEITAIEKRLTAFVIPNAISIVTTSNPKGHFFASFLSRDAAHDLLMAAWRKSYPCSANAHGISSNNIYLRSNRSNGTFNNNSNGNNDDNDNDYDDDTQSFISARTGTLDSRRNRHRRSSSSSQNWTADEAEWDETEDMDEYVAAATTGAKLASSKAPRRRGSKRGVVKKILKDVIAPGQGDDDGSTSDSKRSGGRGRSVSELPPKPSSLDSVSGFGAATESDGTRASNETDGQSSGAVRPRPRVVGGSDSRVPRLASSRIGTLPANIRSISPSKSQAISKGTANGAVTANGSNTAATTTRTPTTCKCSKDGRHYANQFMSETYPGTVEKIWKLLFDSDFNKSFLTSDVMRGADLQDEAWQKSPTDKTLTKTTRYTKWLGLPIGPKTTKATLVDVCEHQDFDDYVTTVTTSSTPDVPSGSSFTAKNRTCITWAGPGLVQVVVTGGVEFTKSSWIKGQIEKGAFDGMTTHYKELNLALRKHIAAHSEEFGAAANGAGAASARVKDLDVKEGSDAGSVSGGRTSKNRQKGRTQGPEAERDRAKAAEAAAAAAAATAALANKGFGAGVNASKTSSDSKGGVLGVLLGLLEPLASLWSSGSSTLSTMATSGKQTGTGLLPLEADSAWSQVAVLSVLVLVMFANIYIWFLISSVTSQIERIQGDVFVQTHGGGADSRYFQGRGRQPYRSPQYMWTGHQEDSMQGGLDGDENEEFGSDSGLTGDMFTREQEEAMWAWLTEREDRHRQHQQHRGSGSRQKQKPRPKMTKPKQPEEGDVDGDEGKGGDRNDKSDQHQALAKDIDQFAETEDRLRARIRELQDQVESLEKAATGSQ